MQSRKNDAGAVHRHGAVHMDKWPGQLLAFGICDTSDSPMSIPSTWK